MQERSIQGAGAASRRGTRSKRPKRNQVRRFDRALESRQESSATERSHGSRLAIRSRPVCEAATTNRAGEFDKARKVYEDLRRKRPDDLEVVHRLGVVADLQKRHAEAESLFLHALAAPAAECRPAGRSGLLLLPARATDQGRKRPEQGRRRCEPSNPRFKNNLGLVIWALGTASRRPWHISARPAPEADAQYNLAFVYAAQNRNEQAKALFSTRPWKPTRRIHAPAKPWRRSTNSIVCRSTCGTKNCIAADGVRYVPFIEGDVASDGSTVQSGIGRCPVADRPHGQPGQSFAVPTGPEPGAGSMRRPSGCVRAMRAPNVTAISPGQGLKADG